METVHADGNSLCRHYWSCCVVLSLIPKGLPSGFPVAALALIRGFDTKYCVGD
jgi:hypothetical protein